MNGQSDKVIPEDFLLLQNARLGVEIAEKGLVNARLNLQNVSLRVFPKYDLKDGDSIEDTTGNIIRGGQPPAPPEGEQEDPAPDAVAKLQAVPDAPEQPAE
jgi:hypothetical protein